MTGAPTPPGAPARSLAAYTSTNLFVFGIFLVFVIARYMQWSARRPIFATIRLEFVLGLALVVACTYLIVANRLDFRPAKNIILLIGALFVTMIVQIPFAAAGPYAWDVFFDRVVKFSMLTYFLLVLVRSPFSMRLFIAAFLLSLLYVCQESTRGAISGQMIWENQGVPRLHGSVPIYDHPNSLGSVTLGTIPYVVFLFPVVRNFILRGALALLLVTALVCVLYSGSRTAYVGFCALIVIWFFLSARKWRFLIVAAAMFAAATPAIPTDYVERFESITGQEEEGGSRNARIQILEDALAIFAENPGGIGIASFPWVRQAKFGRSQDTHNLYLEVATNLGAQGLVVFLALNAVLLTSLRRAWRNYDALRATLRRAVRRGRVPPALRRHILRQDRDLEFLVAVAKATFTFLLIRLVVGFFGMDLYEIYWWFCSGVAGSLLFMIGPSAARTRTLVATASETAAAAAEND
jgi:O-antigen ligase